MYSSMYSSIVNLWICNAKDALDRINPLWTPSRNRLAYRYAAHWAIKAATFHLAEQRYLAEQRLANPPG